MYKLCKNNCYLLVFTTLEISQPKNMVKFYYNKEVELLQIIILNNTWTLCLFLFGPIQARCLCLRLHVGSLLRTRVASGQFHSNHKPTW